MVKQLQLYANSIINDLEICAENINWYNALSFSALYNEKVEKAPQNAGINTFTYAMQKDLKKYSEQRQLFYDTFKLCYEL